MASSKAYAQCLKITQNVSFEFLSFGIFNELLVHSKCKRSSLRSQCWMRLFLWISNTVEYLKLCCAELNETFWVIFKHCSSNYIKDLSVFTGKYCVLIEKEGGLELLEELINSNTSPPPYGKILELASVVRANVNQWRNGQNQSNGSLEFHQQALDYDGWEL